MDMMAASKLVIGPSSGPMHLASLCKTPHLVWTGKQWSSTIKAFNDERYTWKWNPFRTKCKVIVKDNPDLSAKEVIGATISMLKTEEKTDEPGCVPGTTAAKKWTAYWTKRVKQQGRTYVARSQRGLEKQTRIISDKLRSLINGGHFDHGLDYGCGWGRFSGVLAEHCDKVTAVDIVDTFRDDAPKNVEFQKVGFPTKIDLPDGSVDLFVSALVFQHIVDDPWLENVTAEIRRVLADSAMVIVVDDNGKPAAHVKQRPYTEFERLLGLGWVEDKLLDMDGPKSHHIVVGSHRKD
jgi:SAM-dependent methyltransferase